MACSACCLAAQRQIYANRSCSNLYYLLYHLRGRLTAEKAAGVVAAEGGWAQCQEDSVSTDSTVMELLQEVEVAGEWKWDGVEWSMGTDKQRGGLAGQQWKLVEENRGGAAGWEVWQATV